MIFTDDNYLYKVRVNLHILEYSIFLHISMSNYSKYYSIILLLNFSYQISKF